MSAPTQSVKYDTLAAWDCATTIFTLASELELDAGQFRSAGFTDFATHLDNLAIAMRISARNLAAVVPAVE